MVVVDDFGILHGTVEVCEKLFQVLRLQYVITTDNTGSKYLGIDIIPNANGSVSLSMPGYVQNALNRFGVTLDSEGTHSPLIYHPIVYGPQVEHIDASPTIDEHRTKRIQQIVGVFLYYARAVDESMLCALNKIASRQSNPTEELEKDVNRFLQYAATYPNGKLTFWPSDLQLFVHSDASYASETNSRSRSGAFYFLGKKHTSGNNQINGGLGSISKILPNVLSSAAEAEYAALFMAARRACIFQNILADLGFPQRSDRQQHSVKSHQQIHTNPPTPIHCDAVRLDPRSDRCWAVQGPLGCWRRELGIFFHKNSPRSSP
jgi:hypothetical protein